MSKLNPEELEKIIHESLRSLPESRAPRSLEANVWSAIQAQQALPWWRQSFTYWPLVARAVFLFLSGALAAISVTTLIQWIGEVSIFSELSDSHSVLSPISGLVSAWASMRETVFGAIPIAWIYGGVGFFAVMYAALIGLGATAYRLLFSRH